MSQKFDNFNFFPQFVNPQSGTPGTITIAQNGIPVTGSPVSGLNFTNPATAITISGGVATVNLFGDGTIVSFGPIGSAPNANGATISGSGVITLEPASVSYGGLITATAQSLAGAKTWTGAATFSSTVTAPSIYGAAVSGGSLNLYGNSVDGNYGIINVHGDLSIGGNEIDVASGTNIIWQDGVQTFSDGYGNYTISANSINLTTTLSTINLDPAERLEWGDGPVIQSDGNNNLDITANNVSISNNLVISSPGGQVQFQNGGNLQSDDFGNIAVGGNLIITGGQITFGDGSGFTDTGGGAIQVFGNLYFYSSGQTLSWVGGAQLSSDGAGALQLTGTAASYYKTTAGALSLSGFTTVNLGYGSSPTQAATFGATNTISTATTFNVGATFTGLNKITGTGAALQIAQSTPASAVSAASTVALRANNSTNHMELSENAGTYYQVATTYSTSSLSSGAVTLTPVATDNQFIVTATGSISSLTIATTGCYAGQRVRLLLQQGTSASYTWPTVFVNSKLAGGSFTKTTTVSAVDSIVLEYNGTSWFEVARALNES